MFAQTARVKNGSKLNHYSLFLLRIDLALSYGTNTRGTGYGGRNRRNQSCIHLWGKKIPDRISNRLLSAKTATEASNLVAKEEKKLANFVNPDKEGFLDCDEAASVLDQVLTVKGIEHKVVVGKSRVGDSHAYVIAKEEGKEVTLDPTDQL